MISKKDKSLAKLFKNISILLEIKGESVFKISAYTKCAEMILSEKLKPEERIADGTLATAEGIGKALTEKITEFYETGKITFYEKLTAELPETLIDITKISGLGAKRTAKLFYELGIKDLTDLEKAVADRKIESLKGFGAKTQADLANSLEHKKASKNRYSRDDAENASSEIMSLITDSGLARKISLIGTNRRFAETIDKISILVGADDISNIADFVSKNYTAEIAGSSVVIKNESDIPIEITSCPETEFPAVLHKLTGSEEYLAEFDKIAESKGISTDNCTDEIELYERAGLKFVPPELRESPRYLSPRENPNVPELVELNDMRGMLHIHTEWSDGADTIADMALASKSLGCEYVAVCDHSRFAAYAGGLSIERVFEQFKEIDRLNSMNLGIRILKGIESDILKDGSPDYPDEILEQFDIVVASVHSIFKMSREEMTDRLIKAVTHPHVDILGHPTGRLLLVRDEYPVDIRKVIDAAADCGKIIEINANPYRLDLSWKNAEYALSKGVKLAVNPDSHKTSTLSDIRHGISVARKAGATRSDIVNALSCDELLKMINK